MTSPVPIDPQGEVRDIVKSIEGSIRSLAKDVRDLGNVARQILESAGVALTNGVAKLYKPIGLRREGMAKVDVRAYELERMAKAQAAQKLIESAVEVVTSSSSANDVVEVRRRAGEKLVALEMIRLVNLENVLIRAVEEAELWPRDEPTQPIDPDWLRKFADAAQEASDDEVQKLWARILARKARAGGVSLATLDLLRLVDRDLALSFEHAAKLCTYYGVALETGAASYAEVRDFGYRLGMLSEIGLLKPIDMGRRWSAPRFEFGLPLGLKQYPGDDSVPLKLVSQDCFALSIRGAEVAAAVLDSEYVKLPEGAVRVHESLSRLFNLNFRVQYFDDLVKNYFSFTGSGKFTIEVPSLISRASPEFALGLYLVYAETDKNSRPGYSIKARCLECPGNGPMPDDIVAWIAQHQDPESDTSSSSQLT